MSTFLSLTIKRLSKQKTGTVEEEVRYLKRLDSKNTLFIGLVHCVFREVESILMK